MPLITILGATGFIGSNLAARLQSAGHKCYCPARNEDLSNRELGYVFYCIGLTADYRNRPYETVDAHVSRLTDIFRNCNFERLTYLSSTRLYGTDVSVAHELDSIRINPSNVGDLYNISKTLGESIAIASKRDVRIARLSNVYGPDFQSDNFLSSILKTAISSAKITLRTSLDSSKDYISIEDVIELLIKITFQGRTSIYNIASGVSVTNGELVDEIKKITDCEVQVAADAERTVYPRIDVTRIREEFDFKPHRIIDDLPDLIEMYIGSVRV